MTKLVTSEEAGRILGGQKPISVRTLSFWRQAGTGPDYVKVGRSYRYDEEALLRFLEANRVTVSA